MDFEEHLAVGEPLTDGGICSGRTDDEHCRRSCPVGRPLRRPAGWSAHTEAIERDPTE